MGVQNCIYVYNYLSDIETKSDMVILPCHIHFTLYIVRIYLLTIDLLYQDYILGLFF